MAVLILLVVCRRKAILMSSLFMPFPLSVILMDLVPPSSISTEIRVAPASMEFSSNSLTIEEGLSTTSPAAI